MKKVQLKTSRPTSGNLEVIDPGEDSLISATIHSPAARASTRNMAGGRSSNISPVSRTTSPNCSSAESGSLSAPGTPTKKVSLLAVKRKDVSNGNGSLTELDRQQAPSSNGSHLLATASISSMAILSSNADRVSVHPVSVEKTAQASSSSDEPSDVTSDGDESGEGEEDILKAPSQLILEFLDCVMEKDYGNAAKLCQMILIYEPSNPEALNFQPLIQAKIAQDAINDNDEDSDNDSDEDNEEDEGSDEDDTDDSDYSDNSSSDDSEDDNNEKDCNNEEKNDTSTAVSHTR